MIGSDLQRALDAVAADVLRTSDLLDAAADDAPLSAQVVRTLGEVGWSGCAVSEAQGGLGLAAADLVDLCEVAGRRLFPAALRDEALLLAPLLEVLVRRGHPRAERMLAATVRGDGRGGGAAVLDAPSASLLENPRGWLLTLDRVPAWLVPGARLVAVRAATWVALLDLDVVDLRIDRARALEPGQGMCTITCDQAALGDVDVVCEDAALALLHRHRTALLAECIGVAGYVLPRAVDYAMQRQQFGRPIAGFQAVAHLLSDARAALDTSRSGLARLVAITPPSWIPDDSAQLLALALAHAIPAATRVVCENAIQVYGGLGFTWEHGLHLHYRRALQLQVALGGASGSAAAAGARYLDSRRRHHDDHA
jgi:alkylation response protein AidB-like acyl-CoA dehydrogenase